MPDEKNTYRSDAEDQIFNSNLKEFANRIGLICGLEANEKLSPAQAYDRIKKLWKQLKASKKNLRVGFDDVSADEQGQGSDAERDEP